MQTSPTTTRQETPSSSRDYENPMPANVKLLGSRDRGMVVVGPTEGDVLDILRKMNKLMKERRVKAKFDKWISEARDDSVRLIQGGRMEIFLDASGKSSLAFDTIVGGRLPPASKPEILRYARRKAQEDPRLKGSVLSFSQFSLICSYGMVDAQAPHIDCMSPNFQFGLAVSEGSTGTMFFEPSPNNHIETAGGLVEHWQHLARNAKDPDDVVMTHALVDAVRKDPAIRTLLLSFGDVLLPSRHMLYNMQKETNLQTGCLLSLPGSVVHAAPATASFRSVIFFSGCPQGNPDAVPYNPDTQYTGVMLAAHITSILWSQPGIGSEERYFLLRRLVQYVEGSTVYGMWGHFAPGPLADFIGNVEEKTYVQQRLSKEDYIRKMADMPKMGSPRDPFSAEGTNKVVDLREYKLVSVPNLHTLWGKDEFLVEVWLRGSDGKVVLRYPSMNGEIADEFEGASPEDKFRLVMKEGCSRDFFDGVNGEVYDTNEVKVVFCNGHGAAKFKLP